jgi:hypothetical protein
VVIAGVYGLAAGVQEALDGLVQPQVILPMERQGDRVHRHPKVYAKGWWKSGTKKLCLADGEMRMWWGEGEDIELVSINDAPIVEGAFGGDHREKQPRVGHMMWCLFCLCFDHVPHVSIHVAHVGHHVAHHGLYDT